MTTTVNYLSYYHPLTLKVISIRTSVIVEKALKNHYIISNKTSINNGNNTNKSRFITIR